ncbi:DUF4394 domain-containing protein [soil metagenome]
MRISLALRRSIVLSAAVVGGLVAASAQAELIYGLTSTSTSLVSFDSASANTVSAPIPITGVTVGLLRGIDFRPANGLLYGLSYTATAAEQAQLYTINTTTGVATAVGGPVTLTGTGTSTRVSIDFNPVADALRVATGTNTNYRISPTTGAILGQDTNFAYAAGDPGAGTTPLMGDVAYSNNVAGATSTTLYGHEFIRDAITIVNPPNSGQMTSVGLTLPVTAFDAGVGFDISGATGIAYLSLDDGPSPSSNEEIYTVNLATGATTLIGNEIPVNLIDISVAPVPEPASIGVAMIAGLGVLARRRRA